MERGTQHLVVSIPTDAVGLIIGKSGKNLTKISQESQAKVFLQSHHDVQNGSHERMLIVDGDEESIIKAMRMIMTSLVERKASSFANDILSSVDSNGEKTSELVKWLIPDQLCGVLIGKGGDGIKSINSASGAWVKIAHVEEASPGSEERLVYIRGTNAQVKVALKMVKDVARGRPFDANTTVAQSDAIVVAEASILDFAANLTIPVTAMSKVFTAMRESPILTPTPIVNITIDPGFDFKFFDDLKVRVRGPNLDLCESVKATLVEHIAEYSHASQQSVTSAALGVELNLDTLTSSPSSSSSSASGTADHLISKLVKGVNYVLKVIFKSSFFVHLSAIRDKDDRDLIECLKHDFDAEFIHVPTAQKFSSSVSRMEQCSFICHEDNFYAGIENILLFMACVKDSSTLSIPVQSNSSAKRNIDDISGGSSKDVPKKIANAQQLNEPSMLLPGMVENNYLGGPMPYYNPSYEVFRHRGPPGYEQQQYHAFASSFNNPNLPVPQYPAHYAQAHAMNLPYPRGGPHPFMPPQTYNDHPQQQHYAQYPGQRGYGGGVMSPQQAVQPQPSSRMPMQPVPSGLRDYYTDEIAHTISYGYPPPESFQRRRYDQHLQMQHPPPQMQYQYLQQHYSGPAYSEYGAPLPGQGPDPGQDPFLLCQHPHYPGPQQNMYRVDTRDEFSHSHINVPHHAYNVRDYNPDSYGAVSNPASMPISIARHAINHSYNHPTELAHTHNFDSSNNNNSNTDEETSNNYN